MTCLREDEVGPCPVSENQHSPSLLQMALSLLVTSPVSQQLKEDLRGFSRRQKWQGNHRPMQSELPVPEACTPQTRLSWQTVSCLGFSPHLPHSRPEADLCRAHIEEITPCDKVGGECPKQSHECCHVRAENPSFMLPVEYLI